MVIDHLAKPPIGCDLSAWSQQIRSAAAHSNVFAKVSGLYSAKGDRYPWTVDDLRPAFEIALDAFGANRLMFGSDWPICEVAGGYAQVMGALLELTSELSHDERASLRGGTAIHCYELSMA
jgi:L-fuconolactonase